MTNQPTNKQDRKICSICGDYYQAMGNNAWPVNPGNCCDDCNAIVVTHRMNNVDRGLNAYADPEWYQDIVTSMAEFWQQHKACEHAKLAEADQPTFKGNGGGLTNQPIK